MYSSTPTIVSLFAFSIPFCSSCNELFNTQVEDTTIITIGHQLGVILNCDFNRSLLQFWSLGYNYQVS